MITKWQIVAVENGCKLQLVLTSIVKLVNQIDQYKGMLNTHIVRNHRISNQSIKYYTRKRSPRKRFKGFKTISPSCKVEYHQVSDCRSKLVDFRDVCLKLALAALRVCLSEDQAQMWVSQDTYDLRVQPTSQVRVVSRFQSNGNHNLQLCKIESHYPCTYFFCCHRYLSGALWPGLTLSGYLTGY